MKDMDENLRPTTTELPAHNMHSIDGEETSDPCHGGEADEIEQDVGVFTAVCSSCRAPFVYSFKKSWIPDTEFEEDLNGADLDEEILE